MPSRNLMALSYPLGTILTMGYRGKVAEQAEARRLRADGWTLLAEGREHIGRLGEQEFLVAGTALYAGEGAKGDGSVRFANSDPRMLVFFCTWLRRFFDVDETRLRLRLYLHEGLDIDAAVAF